MVNAWCPALVAQGTDLSYSEVLVIDPTVTQGIDSIKNLCEEGKAGLTMTPRTATATRYLVYEIGWVRFNDRGILMEE